MDKNKEKPDGLDSIFVHTVHLFRCRGGVDSLNRDPEYVASIKMRSLEKL